MEAVAGGNGIVTDRTFLGSLTRVSVLLSGDVAVKVDKSSTGRRGPDPWHLSSGRRHPRRPGAHRGASALIDPG